MGTPYFLFDIVEEIREWHRDPETGDVELPEETAVAVEVIFSMAMVMTEPPPAEYRTARRKIEELRAALRRLDVSEVVAARDELLNYVERETDPQRN